MIKNNIIQIIDVLQSGDFYGGGEWIEIAKGKNQIADNWSKFIRKVKRIIK